MPGFDYPMDPFAPLGRRFRRGVQSYAARIPGVLVDIAMDEYQAALRGLRHDLQEVIAYLEGLPLSIRKAATYEFFRAFFDHYLPRKFIDHYVYARGVALQLSEKEMIDCQPYINVLNCKAFNTQLLASGSGGSSIPLKVTCPSGAMTNGTLGQFSTRMNGVLEIALDGTWVYKGKMSFYDEWDFDPKDFTTGGRSTSGEIKTRVANVLLPGTSFKITSVEADFSQSDKDGMIVWKGGTPVAILDKVSGLDQWLSGN